jgi:glycosyltransferase involved in cell wall biosynthesis
MSEFKAYKTPVEISLVVPAYNEEAVLPEFLERAKAVLNATGLSWEIIFADDGSHDATADIIRTQHRRDPRIGLISLSRNFGKEIAMTARLDHSSGKAVIVIDADLQDPPELIPDMVALWGKGYDMSLLDGQSARAKPHSNARPPIFFTA